MSPELTFILLARSPSLQVTTQQPVTSDLVCSCPMIGDVNLFLPDGPEGDVECEIMLAGKPSCIPRRKLNKVRSVVPGERIREGSPVIIVSLKTTGQYSLYSLTYVVNSPLNIRPSQFIARIGANNVASLRLFDKLGFGQVKLVEVWNEIELRWGWEDHPTAKAQHWSPGLLEGRVGIYA